MRKYILGIVIIGLGFTACNTPNEKEIGEVDALLSIVDETEKLFLSIDTARAFAAKRILEVDLAEFNKYADTLKKEEAFKIADIFGGKRTLYRLVSNYPGFTQQLEMSKKQLTNLKKDLENNLINKENYTSYYGSEQKAIMDLNNKISNAIAGLETVIGKYELDRPELLEIIEDKKLKLAVDE
ncbi:MAG: hypothetical protein JKY30_08640 [Flavobacteriales bacterium]|nr:hypothetical protein [Flavobacteriales bacterium]